MLTIESWLQGLGWEVEFDECPHWPPDLYAIAGGLLKRSGAYLRIFSRTGKSTYLDGVDAVGSAWRERIEGMQKRVTLRTLRDARPDEVLRLWKSLIRHRTTHISAVSSVHPLSEHLVRMALIADEASAGIGIDWELEASLGAGRRGSIFLSLADAALASNGNRSFCLSLSADVICVLAKQHTPQVGATFRSISLHLALYMPTDIRARWLNPYSPNQASSNQKNLNLLLLPWPTQIQADDFSEVRRPRRSTAVSSYFRFDPKRRESLQQFRKRLGRAFACALQICDKIDGVVFPELALTRDQYYVAEHLAFQHRSILVTGVRESSHQAMDFDRNCSVLQPAGVLRGASDRYNRNNALIRGLELAQEKHHRWRLTPAQIVNYQLEGRLPAVSQCWENLRIEDRVMSFATVNKMTWGVLVCEDLARQDPAAELIRAVGPNLLIALLMDGPQLKERAIVEVGSSADSLYI